MKILAIRHIVRESAGTLEDFLRTQAIELNYWDIPSDPGREVNLADYSAIVTLGGPMGVYEASQYPFLKREMDLLRHCIQKKKPLLGICLGAQLIAAALGARVHAGPWKEIGWYPIRFEEETYHDPVFRSLARGKDRSAMVFHWHGDTFDIPKGAALLANSALYKNQAFRYDNYVYAIQFHVEMTQSLVFQWTTAGRAESVAGESYIDFDVIVGETPGYIADLEDRSRAFYESFFQEVVLK